MPRLHRPRGSRALSGLRVRLHNASAEHFRTGRLTIRDWVAADLESAFAIWSRVEVTRWVFPPTQPPVTSLTQMKQMLDQRIARNHENPAYGMWAVELPASGC